MRKEKWTDFMVWWSMAFSSVVLAFLLACVSGMLFKVFVMGWNILK